MRYTLVTVTWLHDSVYHGRSQKKIRNCFFYMCPPKKWSKKVWQQDLSAWFVGFFRSYSWKRPCFSLISKGFLRFSTFFQSRPDKTEASITKPLPGGPGSCCWRNRRPFMKGFLLGGKMDALNKFPMISKCYLMMISWCVFFLKFGSCWLEPHGEPRTKSSGIAEVEDFSGRQTFQVWHDPKKTCETFRSVVDRSLPRKTFSARTLKVLESRALHKPQASEFWIESLEFSILLGKPANGWRPIARTPWSLQRAVARWGYCEHLSEDCMETAMPSIDLYSSSIWFLSWRPFEMSSKTIVKPWKCVFNDIENFHINLQNSPRTQIVQRDLGEESLRRRLIRYWAVTKTFACWLYTGDEKLPSYIHSLKLTSRTWKWMVGIRSFPFGAKKPIFRCYVPYLLVSGAGRDSL